MSLTTPQAQSTDQDPQATPDPTPAAAAPAATPAAPTPAPAASPGPWAGDLEQMFQDEAVRGQVDGFLRSKVQPHVTQLEQKAALAEGAGRLWNDLEQDPINTYVQLTAELFGEQAADELLGQLQAQYSQEPPNGGTPQETPSGGTPPQADPRLEELYEFYQQSQAQQFYDQEMTRIQQEHPEVIDEFFDRFVHLADGDFDEAYRLYTDEMARLAERFGSAGQPAPVPQAPPVSGSDTGSAPAATPTLPRKESLHEAIEGFVKDANSREAPPIAG